MCITNMLIPHQGHDAHTAMLLGVAKLVVQGVRDGTLVLKRGVKFCFQPAEERSGGALRMIQHSANIMQGVTNCFGMHVNSSFAAHTLHYSSGPVKASCDFWTIEIQGT